MRSFKSNENIHKKEGGSYYVVSANKASSVTLTCTMEDDPPAMCSSRRPKHNETNPATSFFVSFANLFDTRVYIMKIYRDAHEFGCYLSAYI